MLGLILLFTFLASAVSLFLVSILLLHQRLITKISFHLVSFAAGALLAAGLTDTMPEAVERSQIMFVVTTIFIALFFLIEKIFLNLHHHESEVGKPIRLPIPLLLFGDALHNFIDGVAIASTFLVSLPLGIVTSVAVFIHEIPHELGDFGILLHIGYKRKKIIIINILTGIAAFAGAFLGFFIGGNIQGILPVLLALTTANFVYLSLADLLPEIHHRSRGELEFFHTLAFFLGIAFIILLTQYVKA